LINNLLRLFLHGIKRDKCDTLIGIVLYNLLIVWCELCDPSRHHTKVIKVRKTKQGKNPFQSRQEAQLLLGCNNGTNPGPRWSIKAQNGLVCKNWANFGTLES
jgi:hypothetical protein